MAITEDVAERGVMAITRRERCSARRCEAQGSPSTRLLGADRHRWCGEGASAGGLKNDTHSLRADPVDRRPRRDGGEGRTPIIALHLVQPVAAVADHIVVEGLVAAGAQRRLRDPAATAGPEQQRAAPTRLRDVQVQRPPALRLLGGDAGHLVQVAEPREQLEAAAEVVGESCGDLPLASDLVLEVIIHPVAAVDHQVLPVGVEAGLGQGAVQDIVLTGAPRRPDGRVARRAIAGDGHRDLAGAQVLRLVAVLQRLEVCARVPQGGAPVCGQAALVGSHGVDGAAAAGQDGVVEPVEVRRVRHQVAREEDAGRWRVVARRALALVDAVGIDHDADAHGGAALHRRAVGGLAVAQVHVQAEGARLAGDRVLDDDHVAAPRAVGVQRDDLAHDAVGHGAHREGGIGARRHAAARVFQAAVAGAAVVEPASVEDHVGVGEGLAGHLHGLRVRQERERRGRVAGIGGAGGPEAHARVAVGGVVQILRAHQLQRSHAGRGDRLPRRNNRDVSPALGGRFGLAAAGDKQGHDKGRAYEAHAGSLP